MPDSLECVDRQWEGRSVASLLIADALDSLMAQGMGEHDALGALEFALKIRHITFHTQIAQD
jgi:hypothetical protein